MKSRLLISAVALAIAAIGCGGSPRGDRTGAAPPAAAARGGVRGHLSASGLLPANEPVRMSADPMCARANAGRTVQNGAVLASDDGSLANVFVELVGTFPETPVPTEPVLIDQSACVYRPRVIGMRMGQTLAVRNSDDGLHNVHGV